MKIPALHSTLDPTTLAGVIAADYELGGAVACAVWHRGFNDYYDVHAPAGRFVLRVYPTDKYWMPGESDVRFELDLLTHLHASGLPVVPPVRRRDDDVVGIIEAPEGARYAALFEFAPGSSKELEEAGDFRAVGAICARIHESASHFVTEHSRYRLDAGLLLDMPVREVSDFLNGTRDRDVKSLRALVERVREQIETIPENDAFFGVIHADLHSGNVLWTDAGPTVLDFDHCGYGWRAYDFVAGFDDEAGDQRDAFVEGYRSVREITEAELDMLPAFRAARYIWNYGDILAMADHLGVRGRLNEAFWDRYFERVRKMLQDDT